MSGSTDTCIPSFVSNFGFLLMLQSIRFLHYVQEQIKKIPERMSVLYFSHNSNRLWDVRCHVKHCCDLGKNPKWHGRETSTGIFEEAQKASKGCVYFDPPKTDKLRTRLSLVKFWSARLWKMNDWRCTHPLHHLDTSWRVWPVPSHAAISHSLTRWLKET